jgi:hypothetical protein
MKELSCTFRKVNRHCAVHKTSFFICPHDLNRMKHCSEDDDKLYANGPVSSVEAMSLLLFLNCRHVINPYEDNRTGLLG